MNWVKIEDRLPSEEEVSPRNARLLITNGVMLCQASLMEEIGDTSKRYLECVEPVCVMEDEYTHWIIIELP